MKKSSSNMPRRDFLGSMTTLGLSAGALAAQVSGAEIAQPAAMERPARAGRLPREVWIATIAQEGIEATSPKQIMSEMIARMESVARAHQPDIICLPELFLFPGNRPPLSEIAESQVGELAAPFVQFARDNGCYVAYSGYTTEAGRYYNAVVLIDRSGQVCGEYRKTRLTTGEMRNGLTPGPLVPPTFETDFGRVGAQVCFDIEWSDGWRHLRDSGAEIVLFPSAFAAGRAVNMRACQNQFVVVSSTRKDTSKIVDITGETIAATSRWHRWVCAAVNLERAFLHTWPFNRHFDQIQAKYGRDLVITTFGEEEWTILESLSPELRVEDVLREFKIETYAEHIARAEAMQSANRPPA
ncbi:MAG TPA: carbon-nitrogen hydrolase family protein [Lacipirellulaceae bacterium]|nr:carbon-nitrogen hydrolase family protein [Lacipirellulaceae bacterium]